MNADQHISDLLRRWQEARAQGRSLSLQELCRDRPELLDEVKARLGALESMDQVLAPAQTVDEPRPEQAQSVDTSRVEPLTAAFTTEGPPASEADSGRASSSQGRFRIVRPHAEGGLGRVSIARDRELRRDVALKEIKERYADDAQSRSRFLREAEITGRLEHPGIVPVYSVGAYDDGRPFYAMRFIKGDTLSDAITRFHAGASTDSPDRDVSTSVQSVESAKSVDHPKADQPRADHPRLDLRQLLNRFVAVCQAMQYAHDRGVLHRDLKPGNIMLGEYGETLVVDWGLAKPLAGDQGAGGGGEKQATEGEPEAATARSGPDSSQTRAGAVLGTPAFMSPEQATGRLDHLGPASDIYSLGATLYCLLTGEVPNARLPLPEVMRRAERGEFPRPRQVKPTVDPALEAICLKAMAREPADRYASAGKLAEDVEHWLADEPVTAWPEPMRVKVRRWVGRHRVGVATAAAVLIVGSVSLIVANLLLSRANEGLANAAVVTKAAQVQAEKELFHSLLAGVREQSIAAAPGWTWKALADLERARALPEAKLDPVTLRSLTAEALGRFDVRQVAVLAEGVDANCLAFTADGKRLAIGEKKNAVMCSVHVYDVERRERVGVYSYKTYASGFSKLLQGDGAYQEGFNALAFSPDGKWLAAGTRFGKLCRWDTTAPQPAVEVWQGHPDALGDLTFHPAGTHLVSCSLERIMRWDVAKQWQGTPLLGGERGASELRFVAHGEQLAIAGAAELALLTTRDWQPRTSAAPPHGGTLAVNSDGRWLALMRGADIQWVDVGEGKLCGAFTAPDLKGHWQSGSISADGRTLATASNTFDVSLWDAASDQRLARLQIADRDSPIALMSPRGDYLAVTADRRTLLLECRAAQVQTTIAHQSGSIQALALSADGKTLLCAAERRVEGNAVDSQLSLWNVATGSLQRAAKVMPFHPKDEVRFDPVVGGVAFHPDETMAASVSSLVGAFVTPLREGREPWGAAAETPDAAAAIELPLAGVETLAGTVEMRPDGRASGGQALRLAGGPAPAKVRFRVPEACLQSKAEAWSILAVVRVESKTGAGAAFAYQEQRRQQPLASGLFSVEMARVPDADYHHYLLDVVRTSDLDKQGPTDYALWLPMQTPQVDAVWIGRIFFVPLPTRGWPTSLRMPRYGMLHFAPDGRKLWGVLDNDYVLSWNMPKLTLASRWRNLVGEKLFGFARIECLAAGRDHVAVGSNQGDIHLLANATGTLEKTLKGPAGGIRSLAWHPTRPLLAVGTAKGRMGVLGIPEGTLVADLPTHETSVEAVAFNRDGTIFVSGGLDQNVRVWRQAEKGYDLLLTLKAPPGRLSALSLSPDAENLAVLNEGERAVRLYRLGALREALNALEIGW